MPLDGSGASDYREEQQMADDNKSKAQPSGYHGDNPATAGPEQQPKVKSNTPENGGGINPSAPNQATNESGDLTKDNSQAMGSVGYGGENKPMAQPDGTSADLEDGQGVHQKQGNKNRDAA